MKQLNYLQQLNISRSTSKFNLLFESIMKDIDIEELKYTKSANKINDVSLNLILEEIEKPQYVICESSGEAILLEEAIFMPESYLISEGILDKVTEKIQNIINYIKEGIQKVLSKSSEIIKAFCEKVKNNAIVAAIRKKLGLDEKLKYENFKQFIKVTAKGKEVATESVISEDDNYIFTEATKLSKKEEALTDPEEINKFIKKYEDAISGKTVLKNKKTGNPLSKKYCQDRLNLFKKKLQSLSNSTNDKDKQQTSNNNTSNNDNSKTKEKPNKNTENKEKNQLGT